MGVAGLWDILRPAGKTRSLTHLAVVDGFEKNLDGVRGFRIGIDASIWFFHATYGREGENPELRTLFFRCASLMRVPFLPLFVFDGPKRPSVKRGKRISGNSHWLTTGMKNIIEAFGFEWRTAPGEAEAELAYLNQIGIVDGVLSDDVDNFLFGATVVIRNSSNTLSGNRAHPIKNSAGKDDKNHTIVYRMEDISAQPDVNLTRGGLILIGLLSGGDYHQAGLPGCGTKIAHALAKCGFGDSLYHAALKYSRHELPSYLSSWREELRQELRTNSQGHQRGKNIALAKCIPNDFPDIDILLSYTHPITSETEGRANDYLKITWGKEPDLGKLANVCELYFEWGIKPNIIKRFRTVIWPSAILRILRRAVLDAGQFSKGDSPPTPKGKGKQKAESRTPSKLLMKHFSSMQLDSPIRDVSDKEGNEALIIKIHSTRTHTSTDGLLEYRLEIAPALLVRLSEAGLTGIRPPIADDEWAEDDENDEDGNKKGLKNELNPLSHIRVWMPASMVRIAEPDLVKDFEGMLEQNRRKKAGATSKKVVSRSKAKAGCPGTGDPLLSGREDSSKRKEIFRKSKVLKTFTSTNQQVAVGKEDERISLPEDSSCPNVKAVVTNMAVQQDMKSFFAVSKSTAKSLAVGNSMGQPRRLSKVASTKSNFLDPTIIELSDSDDLPIPLWASSTRITGPKSPKTIQRPANLRDIYLCSGEEEEVSKHNQARLLTTSVANTAPAQAANLLAESSRSRSATPTAKHTRKKLQLTSESESFQDDLNKSPRKSAMHNSPRSKAPGAVLQNHGEDIGINMCIRPMSPSPTGFRATTSHSQPVIEISSDSDVPHSKLNVRPLLVARVKKVQRKITFSQKDLGEPAKAKKIAVRMLDMNAGGFIDLT